MQLELWTPAPPTQHPAPGPRARLRVIPQPVQPATGAPLLIGPPEPHSELDALAHRYIEESRSPRTREAYETDWRSFEGWCDAHGAEAFPASALTLARYLTALAQQGRKTSTIHRARIAIGVIHRELGGPRPDRDTRIRTLERGIRRTHGTREESAEPLLVEALERVVSGLGDGHRNDRERALLLVGFAGAFRAGELVGLDVSDLTFRESRLFVQLRRSKEDPLGHGSTTEISAGTNGALCPLRALEQWLGRVGRGDGPLFRHVNGPHAGARLTTRTISRIVQRGATRAGLKGNYSAHSLRSGFATSAFAAGASDRDIQLHGRWKDRRSLDRYIHLAALPVRCNAITQLL